MSAPGPANLNTAKAILAKNGLKDGDYTIDQLDMGQHINAMTAGTFDGGYTLEPNASMMNKLGVARTRRGRRHLQIYSRRPGGRRLCRRLRIHLRFHQKRPDVAKRFAQAWAKAIDLHQQEPGGGAQIPRQEHVHAGQRRRYGPDARLCHGQGHERQSRSTICRSSPISATSIGVVPEKVDVTKVPANVLMGGRDGRMHNQLQASQPAGKVAQAAAAHRAPRHHPRPEQTLRRHRIYDNFDFDIPRGKLMSVFGPNGCGKSTLINMIAGLFPVDAGEILFDGQPLARSSSATCSRTIARRCFRGCAPSTTSPIRSR